MFTLEILLQTILSNYMTLNEKSKVFELNVEASGDGLTDRKTMSIKVLVGQKKMTYNY